MYNLGGEPCIKAPFLHKMLDTIIHADFVFCNEFEIDLVAKLLLQNDRQAAIEYIAKYQKANLLRPRVVIVTQRQNPVLITVCLGD